MNERYRWNEEEERHRAERKRRERGQGPDLSGRDYYGVSGPERNPRANRAWEGREPYPQDVGGINHPGHGGDYGLDPLSGDRGSGEQDYGAGYRGAQYGDEAVPQRERAYSAREARSFQPGHGRYAEGGYEPRGAHRDWDDHEREREARGWWARARDEFRAWMGDREAERRVRRDHALDEYEARGGGDWRGHDDDTAWRDPVRDADVRHEFDRDQGRAPREHRPGMFRDDRGRW